MNILAEIFERHREKELFGKSPVKIIMGVQESRDFFTSFYDVYGFRDMKTDGRSIYGMKIFVSYKIKGFRIYCKRTKNMLRTSASRPYSESFPPSSYSS